jgi:hypothetical protein
VGVLDLIERDDERIIGLEEGGGVGVWVRVHLGDHALVVR